MKDSRESVYDDVLFMKNLGVSEDNIALLKNITLSEVNQILASFQVDYNEQKKVNVIQEVGNQNKWKNKPPSPEKARNIGEAVWKTGEIDQQEYYRTLTKPSKAIPKVDRSDRVGEDIVVNLNASIIALRSKFCSAISAIVIRFIKLSNTLALSLPLMDKNVASLP